MLSCNNPSRPGADWAAICAFEGLPFVRIVCVSAFVAAAMLKQVLVLLAAAQAVDIDYYFGAE